MSADFKKGMAALLLALFMVPVMSAATKNHTLSSPDGTLTVRVKSGESLSYSLSLDGRELIADSPVSMTLSGGKVYGESAGVIKETRRSVDTVIPSPFYKKAEVKDRFNELTLKFREFSFIVRLYDDGMAYRFVSHSRKPFEVKSEKALFSLPERTWARMAYVKNPGSFESQFFNSFENTYEYGSVDDWQSGRLAFLPLLLDYPNGVRACVMEADLRDYPGMYLYNSSSSFTLEGVFAAVPDSLRQGGHNNLQMVPQSRKDYIAACSGAREFPWRIVAVSRTDIGLADCDMVYRLSPAPAPDMDFSWVKPGKVAWEWWNNWNVRGEDFQAGVNTPTYKYYIDFAAEKGIEYVILDEGWSVSGAADLMKVVPKIDLPELISYASSKGVGIILWAGYHAFDRDMEAVCRHYSEMGVKGFKIDFMDRDDQIMVSFHERTARMCAKYHLLADFHGTYKPTGLSRTWPNVINYEGVNGLEQCKWSDFKKLDQVTYDVTMPFIRMAAGPVDYTQGAMKNANRDNFRGVYREPMSQGTRCHQLAEYVVFESPLNMLCDSPANYRQEPECTDFIARIPTVWDETRAVDGDISHYIVMARRKAGTWYVGALSDWDGKRMEVDLGFIPKGKYMMEIFRDGANASRHGTDYKREVLPLPDSRKITIRMASGGGWAARIYPKQ